MGSPEGEGEPDEQPQHQVYLDAYFIDIHEVTNEQFARFVKATGYQAEGDWRKYYTSDKEKHPVVNVSWNDANAYCQWAGKRLPTEAEWEKAARGTDGRRYPWGKEWDSSKCNASGNVDRYERTAPVGSFPAGASPYRVMDMAGNVWEWVANWYDKDDYRRSLRRNPQGPSSGVGCVLRGGSWENGPVDARAANRGWYHADISSADWGFRCALSPFRR
jgi:formylglycine-generating enzyme required for sulfatase activity